jgi:hypothetical protein
VSRAGSPIRLRREVKSSRWFRNVSTAALHSHRNQVAATKVHLKMTHWIGAIILVATFAFIVFAFRQGQAVRPEKRPDNWGQWFSGWMDWR